VLGGEAACEHRDVIRKSCICEEALGDARDLTVHDIRGQRVMAIRLFHECPLIVIVTLGRLP
jgi:hypothetical protein